MPYDKDGKFYTTRIEDDLKGDDPLGRLAERSLSARKGAKAGMAIGSRLGPVGGALGGTLGGISGFILGDREIVFPIDMVAVPAYELSRIYQGYAPSFQIYIKEGEVLSQVIQTEAMEAKDALTEAGVTTKSSKKRKKSKYHAIYAKHFKAHQNRSDYKKKDGTWKKNGFQRAVKAAHKKAKLEMKK